MYDDVIKATRGVEYFHVSTDEVYYAGICSKCDKPYNPENRSLRWVEFVQRAHDFLTQRNRKMLAWVEYPFLVEHTLLLPPGLIDGVLGTDAAEIKAEAEHGVEHLAYTSLQGEELLFPDHFTTLAKDRVRTGRLESVYQEISLRARPANPVGVYGAAWDDSGLHSETFWLGWATVAQYGWNPGTAPVEQTAAEFMNIYYGRDAGSLMEIYRSLQNQARFFQRSWDRVVSRVRGPGYGNSDGKGLGTTRYDQTLPSPPSPRLPGLDFVPVYRENYQERLQEAAQRALENDVLVHELLQAMSSVTRNRYNLEVFLSLARLTGHQNRVLLGMREIEDRLESARQAASKGNSKKAARSLAGAYGIAGTITEERKSTFAELQKVWEKSRFPKGREVNGKKFVHILDDVKDHWADRRSDLSYMIAPEESIGLEKWREDLRTLITAYQKQNHLPESKLEELLTEEEE
jgi:hexosaminidase